MQPEINRKEFAAARPIPPFGVIVQWVSDLLQLDDPLTFPQEAQDATTRKQIDNAISALHSHTAHNLALGEIVKEDTKQIVCNALATLFRALPQLDIKSVPQVILARSIRDLWSNYDYFCEFLSSFPAYIGELHRCLLRHCTLELAISKMSLPTQRTNPQ